MSRRTYPRFAAGLFAAALTAPLLLAQPPNPWRGQSVNPWRNATAAVDVGSAEALPACGKAGCCSAATAAPMPREKHTAANQYSLIEIADQGTVPPRVVNEFRFPARGVRTASAPTSPVKLTGTWYRETPTMVVAFAVTGNEMKITLKANTGEGVGTATITADCAVTKDGTVHGVFTGADVDVTSIKNALLGMELAELQLDLQELVDQPFAFRCRPADGGLMVSNVRLPGSDQAPRELLLCGKYKAACGPIPTPKPAPIVNQYVSDPNIRMQQLLAGEDLRVWPGPYSPCGPLACPVAPPVAACPAPMPTTRDGPPPEVRDTMIRVFTEMMNGPGAGLPACPGPVCIPPAAAFSMAGPPGYPPAVIAPTAYTIPLPPPPPPMPVSAAPATPAGQLPVGTWYREVGPIRYKIEAKNGHLTVTVTATEEEDGKVVSTDHVLTADFYPTRTEGEVVGLITGFDIVTDRAGLDEEDAKEFCAALPEIQQAVDGKPIAFTFRMYDDTLVIGKVRLGFQSSDSHVITAALPAMGGRYTSSPKSGAPAKTKTGKRTAGGMTLPSPRYLEHYPQYFPADPAFPLPRELANQIDPAGPPADPALIGANHTLIPSHYIRDVGGQAVPPMLPLPPLPAPVPAIPRSK